jgi:WD40 repeat protein
MCESQNAHGAKISSLVDAGNGFVWSASDSTTINVWSASTFELYKTFDAHKNKLLSLCRINARIWSCSWDQTIQLWDAEVCVCVRVLPV